MLNQGTNFSFRTLRQHANREELCRFFQVHKDKIKTVALPILVIAAVLFFWLYGNAAGSVTVQDGGDAAAPEAVLPQDAAAVRFQSMSISAGRSGSPASIRSPRVRGSLRSSGRQAD